MHPTAAFKQQNIDVSYRAILLIAIPVMLANLAVPIQSMIDTAIVGNMGKISLVAGLGISAQVMLLLLGSFNFLQASTSGLSAQLLGKIKTSNTLNNDSSRDNTSELAFVLYRALLIALVIAFIFIVFNEPIIDLVLPFFGATDTVNTAAQEYLHIRFFGFPAELANYALFGWFAGLGMTRMLLIQQLIISISNVLLSVLFVYGFGMQLEGVAIGTVIAQYLGLAFALTIAYRELSTLNMSSSKAVKGAKSNTISTLLHNTLNTHKLKQLFALNGNIFIRTFLLTLSFAWITRLATQQGETFLASNVILLYILNLSAFALDGIAVSAKTLVGQSFAATQRDSSSDRLFLSAINNTGVINVILALCLCLLWMGCFPIFLDLMTNVDSIKSTAAQFKWYACLLPLAGAAAYWLDGVFFGLTDGTRIRNGMVIVSMIFFPASIWLTQEFGNHGVWIAIYLFLVLRALVLSIFLMRSYIKNLQT